MGFGKQILAILGGAELLLPAGSFARSPVPASDPENSGHWVLNKAVSDEFEGRKLNTQKWLVQGAEGEYQSNWIGRAPSQFSTDNVRLSDGKLMLETRWEPDFDFSGKKDRDGRTYEHFTTAAVISKTTFQYGYMEIKCKAADASITSSFWATGHQSELDIFEFNGRPSRPGKKGVGKEMQFTMIDWSTGNNVRTWRAKKQLDWRVAEAFHVYGCEWSKDELKFFADGELVGGVSRKQLGDRWVLNYPISLWVDSEAFPWQGVPDKADLPVDYEIEYIRVWQKR